MLQNSISKIPEKNLTSGIWEINCIDENWKHITGKVPR